MHPITHAQTRPDHPAMIMAGSGETVTFGEMDAYANRFAQLLRARGLDRGDHFAVLMENNVHYLQVVWGSQRAGTMMVPISTRLTAPEIAYILKDAGAKFLLTSTHYAEAIAGIRSECPDLPLLIVGGEGDEDYEAALAAQPSEPIADQAPGQYMLYSSGTTGRPKGVKPAPPEDDDILAINPLVGLAVMGAGMPADGSMVYLSPAPLYHAAPIGWCTTAQRLGGTVVVMEKFDPEAFLDCVQAHKTTHVQMVPTMFVKLLKLPEDVRKSYDVASLQFVIHAAAPCPIPVKEQMIEWWGPIIDEYYAGSEGNGMTWAKSAEWLEHKGTVGRAIFGELHVCDENGDEVPVGSEGQIYFGGTTPPNYHNDPEKNASALNPKHPDWSSLGDVGKVDEDGFLYLTDRKAFMIISGGVNIYPQEAENVLITHPKVADVAVIGVPDEEFGESVKAIVQPMPGIVPSDELAAELLEFCRGELSKIKCPKSLDFDLELPRHPTGKLYKRLIRDRYWGKKESRIV